MARLSGTFALRAGGALIAFVAQVLMARMMGMSEFGLYTTAWVWVVVLGGLCQLGFSISGTRLVALYLERQRTWRLRRLVLFSALAAIVAGSLAGTAGWVIARAWDTEAEARLVWSLALLAVPMFALHEVAKGLTRGFGKVAAAYMPVFVVRPALLLAGLGLVYAAGVTLAAPAAMMVTVATLALVVVWQWISLARQLPKTSGSRSPRPVWHGRHWLAASMPVLLVDGQYVLLAQLDVILVSAYQSAESVATYFAAARVVALISFVHFAISAVSAEPIARLHARKDAEGLNRLLRRLTQFDLAFTLAGAVFVAVFGRWILGLFGPEFVDGDVVMLVLLAGLVFQAAFGPLRFLLTMTGQQNAMAVILSATSLLNVGLAMALLPIWGLLGAATATTVTLIMSCLLLAGLVRRRLGFWPVIGR